MDKNIAMHERRKIYVFPSFLSFFQQKKVKEWFFPVSSSV
jgi:hypothetical protein